MATPLAAEHDDFPEWKASVEQRLRKALAQAATRPKQQVTQGDFEVTNDGTVRIFGSGGLRLVAPDGTEHFATYGAKGGMSTPSGDPQPVIVMRRDDNTVAFGLWDPQPLVDGYKQFFAFYDRAGNIIFSDDTTSGTGIAKPYMHYSFTVANQFVTLTSTAAFADAITITGFAQNPRVQVPISCFAPATGDAEVRIIHPSSGQVLAGPTAIGTGGNAAPFYQFDIPTAVSIGEYYTMSVQTRRPSGTGNVSVKVFAAYGGQS